VTADQLRGVRDASPSRALAHGVGNVLICQACNQPLEAPAVVLVEALVGIEPEDPSALRVAQAFVSGGSKVIHPGKFINLGAETAGDLFGAVPRAGVDDDYFANEVGNGVQAVGQMVFFIADDHAQGYLRQLFDCVLRLIEPHLGYERVDPLIGVPGIQGSC